MPLSLKVPPLFGKGVTPMAGRSGVKKTGMYQIGSSKLSWTNLLGRTVGYLPFLPGLPVDFFLDALKPLAEPDLGLELRPPALPEDLPEADLDQGLAYFFLAGLFLTLRTLPLMERRRVTWTSSSGLLPASSDLADPDLPA